LAPTAASALLFRVGMWSLEVEEYAKGSRFVSFDEVDFVKAYPALPLDSVDSLDALVSLFSSRLAYCGNVVLGNSSFVEKSANQT
jgi:hypothetical protein